MISVMSAAASKGSSGPRPTASSSTSRQSAARSTPGGKSVSVATICVSSRSASARSMLSLMPATSRRRRSSAASSAACSRRRSCSGCGSGRAGTGVAGAGSIGGSCTAAMSRATLSAAAPSAPPLRSGMSASDTRSRQGPISISSSGNTGAWRTILAPFTRVPPNVPRSSSTIPAASRNKRACWRPTLQFTMRTPQCAPLPINAGTATVDLCTEASSNIISTSIMAEFPKKESARRLAASPTANRCRRGHPTLPRQARRCPGGAAREKPLRARHVPAARGPPWRARPA